MAKAKTDRPLHNYQPAILDLLASIEAEPGTVHHVRVEHDRWCGVLSGEMCNCNPDIRIESESEG